MLPEAVDLKYHQKHTLLKLGSTMTMRLANGRAWQSNTSIGASQPYSALRLTRHAANVYQANGNCVILKMCKQEIQPYMNFLHVRNINYLLIFQMVSMEIYENYKL